MWLLGVCVVMSCLCLVQADLFTAVADLEDLLGTEALLVGNLDNYIEQTEHQLERLKQKAEEVRKEHSIAREDPSGYLANPINSYLLIKRLLTDWTTTEYLMYDYTPLDAARTNRNFMDIRRFMKFPTNDDLTGAVMALLRLQGTYNLDIPSLAKSELLGIKYASQLSSRDCFYMGRMSYIERDYHNTALWMTEALNLYEAELLKINDTEIVPTSKWEILEYLAYSKFMLGNAESALDLTNELLELFPEHEAALENKAYYEDVIKNNFGSYTIDDDAEDDISEGGKNLQDEMSPEQKVMYEKTCRGDLSPPISITSKLRCQYASPTPFTRLARIKEEEALLDPRIVLFRDVLYDSEIEVIKKLATPRLQRATVQSPDTGDLLIAPYRISKSAWLMDEDSDVVARVTRRIEDMTGLTTQTAELLQVANYGIGGYYTPHFDFASEDGNSSVKNFETGDRIATVLFYMSDVALGGATAFPGLDLAVWPKKGSAMFWMNLKKNGDGDFRTWHAACPVLVGSKWGIPLWSMRAGKCVMTNSMLRKGDALFPDGSRDIQMKVSNKWLHEQGQDSRRPCSLDPEE